MQTYSIHPDIHLGPIHLTVADLERSVEFYTHMLGFSLLQQETSTAALTVDGTTPLVVLVEQPGARPKPARATGLYHFAILLPSRVDLARLLYRLADQRYPPQGAADHLVSEALYLADPDGNGIELYRDRPRSKWRWREGQVQMATDPLDTQGLLGELQHDSSPWDGLPAETTLGHVHLHVADLAEAERFYREVLGFDLVARYSSGAIFLSAGGYHHHIGANIWAGVGAPPPPTEAAGLRHFTINLPAQTELERFVDHLQDLEIKFEKQVGGIALRDPSENSILVAVG